MTCDPNGHIYYTDDGSLEVEVQYDEYCDDEWQTDYTTASLSVLQIAVALLVVFVLFVAAYVYWLIQSADLAEQLRHIREQQRRLLQANSAAPRTKFEPPVDEEEPLIIVAATEPTPTPTPVDSSGIDTIPARDAIAGEDDLETGTGGSAVPEQRCDDDDESSIVDDEGDSPPTNEPINIAVATETTTTTVNSSSIDTIPARDREETEGVPSPNSGATMTSTTTTNHP